MRNNDRYMSRRFVNRNHYSNKLELFQYKTYDYWKFSCSRFNREYPIKFGRCRFKAWRRAAIIAKRSWEQHFKGRKYSGIKYRRLL